ncbi:MAG TPA: TIM barrel protein [Candidatus Nanoarchaeia archaeon]|nr:TIM barrel protein [Candidatus Nanoarchaeia archaeon]
MEFDNDYWGPTDRKLHEELEISGRDIGISHGVGDVAQGLKTNIFRGVSRVELGFMAVGKGTKQQPTPETYTKEEREEMRQLARINDVQVSVHATPNLVGLSGMGGEEGTFNPQYAQTNIHEIKKAIEFAADISSGGPVVMHTGEFRRPIYQPEERFEFGKSESGFDALSDIAKVTKELGREESERAKSPIYFVDKRTGQMSGFRRDMEIPVVEEDKTGKILRDKEGNPKINMKTLAQLEEELKEKRGPSFSMEKDPGEFLRSIQEKQLEAAESEQKRRRHEAKEYEEKAEDLKELKRDIIDYGKNPDYMLKRYGEEIGLKRKSDIDNFKANPSQFMDSQIAEYENLSKAFGEAERAAAKEKKELEERYKNLADVESYAMEKTATNMATAALYALELEKKKGLDKPLFIAPENWTPEQYGSHPQELKKIIVESRKQMANILVHRGYEKDDAKKVAEEHIRATLDVGHMNFWRKYYKGSDEEFKDWYKDQVKDLAKSNILGNIHLHDNFGYNDEHLNFGGGNTPVEELMKALKEGGYKGQYIGEPGGQQEGKYHEAWTSVMGLSASPVYRTDLTSRSWTDIESSYFGRTGSPSYLVGENIVPNKEDFTLWSGVRLE